MGAYINGIGAITVQQPDFYENPEKVVIHNSNYVRCIEPDFSGYINPLVSRRMSRIIKRAVTSSRICLKDAGISMPDAIISGTGLGCIEDTEKFLSAMIQNEEKFLQPTHFIQSTHNTISSQIAIFLGCYGYNTTFSHLGTSFESALLDAYLQLSAGSVSSTLLGGFDEMTPAYFSLLNKIGYWKREEEMPLNSKSGTKGSMAGEGSISILLSDVAKEHTYCELLGVTSLYRPDTVGDIKNHLQEFLNTKSLDFDKIDAVLMGINGDMEDDKVYDEVYNSALSGSSALWYKHVSGEFYTAPAFSLLLAACFLKNQKVPPLYELRHQGEQLNNILIYNHFKNKQHSFILVSKC